MKKFHSNKVDVAGTDKEGTFSCPFCGAIISPTDYSKKTYSILEAKMSDAGLAEIVICCKKCGNQISLAGFSLDSKSHKINGKITYIPHI